MQKIAQTHLTIKASVVLIYKNKILLSSEQTIYNNNQNVWNFLKKPSVKGLQLQKAELVQIKPQLFYIKLTDKDVNEKINTKKSGVTKVETKRIGYRKNTIISLCTIAFR